MSAFDPAWIAAAVAERDHRRRSYPRLIAERKLDEEAATADWQAWVIIAEWMETGRAGLPGGWRSVPWPDAVNSWGGVAEPPKILLTWAFLEESAAKALAGIDANLARDEQDVEIDEAPLAARRAKRDAIFCIHALLVRQREVVVSTARIVAEARARWAADAA